MNYGYVENGQVVEGPIRLPQSWRNISGLDKMSTPSLQALGWLPWKLVEGPGEVVVSRRVTIGSTEITETVTRRSYTSDELAYFERQRQEQIERQRRDAYAAEADPIFFKWQRGEATQQDWLNKVSEIKTRFPK